MTWRRQLQEGSFRGVRFGHAPTMALGSGRLGADHSFVGSDDGYSDDTGREPRRGTIDVVVMGDDWQERSTDLRDALEQEGPGVLVHPLHGRRTVQIRHFDETFAPVNEGPVVRFAIQYTETGNTLWPFVVDDTQDQARTTSAAVKARAIAIFASGFDVSSVPGWSRTQSVTQIGTLATSIRNSATAVATGATSDTVALVAAVASLEDSASTLVDTPAALAAAFQAAIDEIETIAGCKALTAAAGAAATSSPTSTPNTDAADANATELDRLVRRLALGRVVELAAATDWDVADDGVDVRNTYAPRIYDAAGVSDVTTRETLIEMASAFVLDIDERVGDLARLRTLDLEVAGETAMTLAWDLYGDASRAIEIVDRNAIRHPLFVPGGEIVVASS